jgi:DNA helicase IV
MTLTTLNAKQQKAVLSDARRVLVLAGAGSGKTKTVISKLQHLVFEKNVKSSNILAITFTKNATNEMIDRLIVANDETGGYSEFMESRHVDKVAKDAERRKRTLETPWISKLTIRTMHSLCYSILKSQGTPVFDNKFKLLTDESGPDIDGWKAEMTAPERAFDIFHKLLILSCRDREYLLKFKRYILDYFVDRVHLNRQLDPLNARNQKTYTTLKGDTVKSKSERDIADWLFRHSIQYMYEHEINVKDFSFKPDFYIPQADLYLEHNSDLSYPMADKEKQFQEGGRTCVTTYERMMNDSNLFNLAMERIVLGRITEDLSTHAGLNYDEEFRSYQDKVKDFLKLVMRLQSMMKTEDANPRDLLAKALKSEHERVRHFYELAIPLIENYKEYCTNKSYLDFEDLIILTIRLLKEHPEVRDLYQKKFRYIMVDEFQDVNSLQVKLLDALLTPDAQLFCVGDDWQAIYGFRGSNVDYIVNFEKHYPGSEVHKLDVNYRSTQTIVGASNEVIRHNKNQIPKDVSAHKQSPSHIEIYRARKPDEDGVAFFIEKVRELNKKGYGKEDILVLSRRSKMATEYFQAMKGSKMFASFKTIHASKGLEAKAVFILGLSEGSGGFPDVWLDDAIFRVVKDVKIDTLLEEERRLFYVAITRAKDDLFLITELGNESQFIDEIPQAFFTRHTATPNEGRPKICPACGTRLSEERNFCGNCGASLKLS